MRVSFTRLLIATVVLTGSANGTPTLVFNKDEHRYTLRQIWESDSEGYRISR